MRAKCPLCGDDLRCAACDSRLESEWIQPPAPPSDAVLPATVANEVGAQLKRPVMDGEQRIGTDIYRLVWVKNGRALYRFVGRVEGLGAVRI